MNLENEIWVQIPGYGNHYEASSLGRIRVKDRVIVKPHSVSNKPHKYIYKGKLLAQSGKTRKGYFHVHIGIDKEKFRVGVHRLILLAFVGECPDGYEACHNNGNPGDNRISNLRWDSHYNNNQDRLKHNTYDRGEDHAMNKYSKETILEIYNTKPSLRDCFEKYGMSITHASRIRRGKGWKHLFTEALNAENA